LEQLTKNIFQNWCYCK